MASGQVTLDRSTALLGAARALAPRLSERAREGERLRTMPPDLVDEVRAAGLFGLATPAVLGGAELPAISIVEVVEELCRADGSAGWSILIGNSAAFLAWLEPAVAAELLAGRPDGDTGHVIGSATFAPTGRLATAGPDRFDLNGRWTFASGSSHADLFLAGAFVTDDGAAPRMLPGRGPDWRLAALPAGAYSVVDTWDAVGLTGTGSHDITVNGLAVAAEHTMSPFFEPARHDGPLWRLPFFALVGVTFAGFPLGVTRRALDELSAFAPTKFRPPGPGPIAADGEIQLALARAEGGLQSARAFVIETLGELWDTACAGDVPDVAQRARFLLANQQAMRVATDAVDLAFQITGAGALHADNPVQRCFRDVHAAAQHIYFSPAAAKRYARTRFGMEVETHLF